MNIAGIGQIAIRVHDLDRAIAFYRDRLGLAFLFRPGPTVAFFDCGGVRLMLDVPEDAQFDHPPSILYFRVEDIQASYAELEQGGVETYRAPHVIARLPDREIWLAFFRDSEGNLLALISEPRL
jgi:methylmalonyl-CoA/ethylmalonyl-CoA epimerase